MIALTCRRGFSPSSSLSHIAGPSIPRRLFSTSRLRRVDVKSTLPSSAEPINPKQAFEKLKQEQKKRIDDGDRGYLAFTKASLFKLTLPLAPPDAVQDPNSPTSKASSPLARTLMDEAQAAAQSEGQKEGDLHNAESENDSGPLDPEPWESRVERGQSVSQVESESASTEVKRKGKGGTTKSSSHLHQGEQGEPSEDISTEFDAKAPAKSVVFLLHSAQPLSYVASLIKAEQPSYITAEMNRGASAESSSPTYNEDRDQQRRDVSLPSSQQYEPSISFHTRSGDGKRWSPATGIGDFLRDAARVGTFVVRIGHRNVRVSVPSFEDRTKFLRASLFAKTGRIESMAKLKAECDQLAQTGTRSLAIGGACLGFAWWFVVCYVTFVKVEYGWDLMEPVTYLVGLGGLLGTWSWVLIHNRDVSYRAVLSETTSRRQAKLYMEKGFNAERFRELVDEVRELRRVIKNVAEDYDLEWDQGETSSGKKHKKALEAVRKKEALEESKNDGKKRSRKEEDEDEDDNEKEEDDQDNEAGLDEDANGTPDGKDEGPKKPKGKAH